MERLSTSTVMFSRYDMIFCLTAGGLLDLNLHTHTRIQKGCYNEWDLTDTYVAKALMAEL
jgi:hypothetical protein